MVKPKSKFPKSIFNRIAFSAGAPISAGSYSPIASKNISSIIVWSLCTVATKRVLIAYSVFAHLNYHQICGNHAEVFLYQNASDQDLDLFILRQPFRAMTRKHQNRQRCVMCWVANGTSVKGFSWLGLEEGGIAQIWSAFLRALAVIEVCAIDRIIDLARVFKILAVSRAPILLQSFSEITFWATGWWWQFGCDDCCTSKMCGVEATVWNFVTVGGPKSIHDTMHVVVVRRLTDDHILLVAMDLCVPKHHVALYVCGKF